MQVSPHTPLLSEPNPSMLPHTPSPQEHKETLAGTKPSHIKCPWNMFMIFQNTVLADVQLTMEGGKKPQQVNLSKRFAEMW